MLENNILLAAISATMIGFIIYATCETILSMRKYPMVPKSEKDDWERLDDAKLSQAARQYYRNHAHIEVKENKEGDENYIKVDPTPQTEEDTHHVAFAFENKKTGDIRFFKGKKYREWSTRKDVPFIDTSDLIKNHIISGTIAIIFAFGIYTLMIKM